MIDEETGIADEVSWGEPVNGLRLGLSVKGSMAYVHLQNVGNVSLNVLSHVRAHEVHLDWYTLLVKAESGLNRQLRIIDSRDRSIAVSVPLGAGESLQHHVDVVEWAKRLVNGARPLAPGIYTLSAVYDVANEKDCWLGRLIEGNGVRVELSGG